MVNWLIGNHMTVAIERHLWPASFDVSFSTKIKCSFTSGQVLSGNNNNGPSNGRLSQKRKPIMPWPFSSKEKDPDRRPVSWTDSLNATDWQHYKDPRNWIPTVLVTTTVLVSVRVYRSYLRRIPAATHVQPSFFRKRSLFGRVTSVGDGDNFHLFHTPGGRLAGWGWLRSVPAKKVGLRGKTVCYESELLCEAF